MSGDGKLTEKIREALRASGASQVIAVHEGYGAEWAVQEHEDPLLDTLAPLIAAEVRKAQADALRDAAEAMGEWGKEAVVVDGDAFDEDTWVETSVTEWLTARAADIEKED